MYLPIFVETTVMKRIITLFVGLIFLGACSQTSNKVEVAEEEVKEVVAGDSELVLSVEGMVCEYACGGSIKKALKASGGVEKVSIDFEDERPSNTVTVLYDSKKINKGEIESIITELNNGQFTLEEIETKKVEKKNSSVTNKAVEESSGASVSAVSTDFEVPNIFEILSGLIL